jgi:serine/threonine protein kinase
MPPFLLPPPLQIIHRDVKLDNVLLTSTTPSKAVAKLADFGLAKLLATGEGEGAVQVKM